MLPQESKKLLALCAGEQLPCGSKRSVPLTVVARVKSLSWQRTEKLPQTQWALMSTSCKSVQVVFGGQATLISNSVLGVAAPGVVFDAVPRGIVPVSYRGNTKTLPGSSESFNRVDRNGASLSLKFRYRNPPGGLAKRASCGAISQGMRKTISPS